MAVDRVGCYCWCLFLLIFSDSDCPDCSQAESNEPGSNEKTSSDISGATRVVSILPTMVQ